MYNSSMPSLADIAAVTKDSDGFGGNNGWWILIILFAIFGGWGNNGWGGNGSSGGVMDAYVLNSDFSTLSRQIDNGFDGLRQQSTSIANGICSLGYDQLAQMNGINTNILTTGNAIQNAIQADTVANMQNVNALQTQLSSCCCENREATMQTRYDMATQNCATLQAIDKVGDRIIDYMANQSAQALRDENFSLKLAASQSAQNNYLISELAPKLPIPAYYVQNPYGCSCNQTYYGTGTTII